MKIYEINYKVVKKSQSKSSSHTSRDPIIFDYEKFSLYFSVVLCHAQAYTHHARLLRSSKKKLLTSLERSAIATRITRDAMQAFFSCQQAHYALVIDCAPESC